MIEEYNRDRHFVRHESKGYKVGWFSGQFCHIFSSPESRLIGELIVYKGIRRPSVRQHFQTTSPLKPRSRFFSYFTYSIYRWGERIIVFFVPVG